MKTKGEGDNGGLVSLQGCDSEQNHRSEEQGTAEADMGREEIGFWRTQVTGSNRCKKIGKRMPFLEKGPKQIGKKDLDQTLKCPF